MDKVWIRYPDFVQWISRFRLIDIQVLSIQPFLTCNHFKNVIFRCLLQQNRFTECAFIRLSTSTSSSTSWVNDYALMRFPLKETPLEGELLLWSNLLTHCLRILKAINFLLLFLKKVYSLNSNIILNLLTLSCSQKRTK